MAIDPNDADQIARAEVTRRLGRDGAAILAALPDEVPQLIAALRERKLDANTIARVYLKYIQAIRKVRHADDLEF